jgi:hypothetical protein
MKLIFTLLFVAAVFAAHAQTKITGKVTDESGDPVPGANIVIKGTYDGTSSGADGSFSFTTEETGVHILAVSFIGYKPSEQEVSLQGKPLSFTVQLREEINQLDGVVIAAGSFTAGEENRRTILEAVDIATTAGATADIAGALNTLPGTQKVGESGRLFVRGGEGRETRTFIDGMVVLDAYSPSAPNTPSRGRFLPFMFKGTSFSTGGYSAEYGQALSSALVLTSKDKALMNQTDIGLLSVGADVAHTQVWDRASVSGKVQYTNIRPYFNLINQRVDWIDPPVSFEGSTAYRQEIGKTGMLKVFGNVNRTTLSTFQHAIEDENQKVRYDLNNDYGYGNAAYQQALGRRWNIRSGVSYSHNGSHAAIDGKPVMAVEKGVHGKVAVEHTVSDRVELRLGGETIARNFVAKRQSVDGVDTQSLEFREVITASFAEVEAYASNTLIAKVGGRVENNNLEDAISVDPRVSLAWKPGERGQFSLAYGRFRQAPENQLLMLDTKLKSEKAEHFIANYQVVTDYRTFRTEVYYKKYNDLVKYDGAFPMALNSYGEGYARGIEFFWRDSKTLRGVDYWVSYSFLDTERDYLNFPVAAMPDFASRHNFSVVYKHFVKAIKSQLGMTYSFASGRPYYDPNVEKFNSSRTPSYHDVSANIAYLPKNWLIIYVSCTNLLGRDNIFGYEFAKTPDANGAYAGRAIRQAATRFMFLGVFITISKNKSVNQLPNL